MLQKRLFKSVLSVAAIAGCIATGTTIVQAQGALPSFRWNNREGFNELKNVIELSDAPRRWGRYRVKIDSNDMKRAVSQFVVNYPDYFDGKFNPDEIEIRVCKSKGSFLSRAKCSAVELDEVDVDTENYRIALYPLEPIPAGSNLELVFDDVKNPRSRGMYQFNVLAESPGDELSLLSLMGGTIIQID